MFIYLFVVYFSFAPVISAITHLYCELFYIQVLTMVIITEMLTSTSHHDIFTYLDYIFSCYLHIYIYVYIFFCLLVCLLSVNLDETRHVKSFRLKECFNCFYWMRLTSGNMLKVFGVVGNWNVLRRNLIQDLFIQNQIERIFF